MAYDSTQPTNSTKIRNLGVVIRPNWVAIEQADSSFKPYAINFNNRTELEISVDPTAIANSYILYCKTDGAGNSELYGINPNSNVIQLTRGIPTISSNGGSNLPGGALFKWGSFSIANGATSASVTFSSAFPTNCWGVVVTPLTSVSTANNAGGISTSNTTGFTCFRGTSTGLITYFYFAIGN